MAQWGKRTNSVGIYDPNRFGEETTVFSAADKTRNKILDLAFEMNNKVSEYLKYEKVHKISPFAKEDAQAKIQELYSLVLDSVVFWMEERKQKIEKLSSANKPYLLKISLLQKEYDDDMLIIKGLDLLDSGESATNEFMVLSKRFLNKYIYQRGISKLEISHKDPVADYSKKAYGRDYVEEDDD